MNSLANPMKMVFRSSRSPETTARDLGAMLANVPGMRERIRKYVELFYSYIKGSIDDPVRAAVVLGPRVVLDIAVQHGLIQGTEDWGMSGPVQLAFWGECVRRGLTARLLAEELEDVHLDSAFTAGFCAEYGVGTLLTDTPRSLRWSRDIRSLSGPDRRDAEEQTLGRTRVDSFVQLARDLELPEELIHVVAHHEGDPDDQPDATRGLSLVTHLANRLGQAITSPQAAEELEAWVNEAARQCGFDTTRGWEIIDRVLEDTPRVATVLGIEVDAQPTAEQLCMGLESGSDPESMTHAELLEWTRILLAENERYKGEAAALRTRLETAQDRDPVTNLPLQPSMVAQLRELCETHADRGSQLTLIHLDVDGFTAFNSHYGYNAGDRLLQQIAQSVPTVARELALFGRVGADSFLMVIENGERAGRLVAERVRASIESNHLVLTNQRARATATLTGLCRVPASARDGERLMAELARKARKFRPQAGNKTLW